MLPLLVKSNYAERKAQNNFRFQLVTGLQPSTQTCRSIPSTASQHVQPGVARGACVDGGTWTQGMGRFWVMRAEMEVRREGERLSAAPTPTPASKSTSASQACQSLPRPPWASPGLVPSDHFRKESWVLMQIRLFQAGCAFPCAPNRKTVVLFLCSFLEFVVGFVLRIAKQLCYSCAFFCALVCAGFWSLRLGLCSRLAKQLCYSCAFSCALVCAVDNENTKGCF